MPTEAFYLFYFVFRQVQLIEIGHSCERSQLCNLVITEVEHP